MNNRRAVKINILIFLLFLLPLISIGFKLAYYKDILFGKSITSEKLQVKQDFILNRSESDTVIFLLPSNNSRQNIANEQVQSGAASFIISEVFDQRCLRLNPCPSDQTISYSFEFQGKSIKYEIDPTLYFNQKRNILLKDFLFKIFYESNGDLLIFEEKLKSGNLIYKKVCGYDISEKQPKLKVWIEVIIGNSSVPFDLAKGVFAEKPASYIDLGTLETNFYKDPDSLSIQVSNELSINKDLLNDGMSVPFTLLFFVEIFRLNGMPLDLLIIILLTPLAALLIAIFRNAIGVQTFGTFLPMLIAMSFLSTGFFMGALLFIVIIASTAIFHFPISKLGLLTVPKLAIILTTVEGIYLFLIYLGYKWDISLLLKSSLFPVVILTFATERFINTSTDKGYSKAFFLALKTLLVSSFCFLIYKSIVLAYIFLIFPELVLCVIAINLSLGTWIGLRMSEILRFRSLEKF